MNPIELYKRSNSSTSELTGVRRPVAPESVSRVSSTDASSVQRTFKSDGGDAVRVQFSSAARSYADVSEKSASRISARPEASTSASNSNGAFRAVA